MAGRTIPVDEVIAEACTVLRDVSEQEKIFMRQWAYTAMRKIGFSNIDIKISDDLELSDWSVPKPDDLLRTIDIALYDSSGAEIIHTFKGYGTPLEESGSSRIHKDIRSSAYSAIAITESNDYFNVEEFEDPNPDSVYLKVKYFAAQVDDSGLPKIPAYATLAVIMYIRAMWAMRKNDNRAEIAQNWQMWLQERASAEGKGKTPDMVHGKQIAKSINSMIQKVVVTNRDF